MSIIQTTDQTFKENVILSNKPVLVDFYADWCGPCRMIAPILSEVSQELAGEIVVAKVDVDRNPETAAKYGVRSIPTLKIFKDGKVAQTVVGLQPKSRLVGMLRSFL